MDTLNNIDTRNDDPSTSFNEVLDDGDSEDDATWGLVNLIGNYVKAGNDICHILFKCYYECSPAYNGHVCKYRCRPDDYNIHTVSTVFGLIMEVAWNVTGLILRL